MTKILVFSDSHGNSSSISNAIEQHPDASMALFLGDGIVDFLRVTDLTHLQTVCVRGNCDFYRASSDIRDIEILTVENVRIMMTHGHLFGVKSGLGTALDKASEAGSDIFLFGHTHVPFDRTFIRDGKHIRLFNPGSVGRGRENGNTYGIIIIDRDAALTSHGRLK